MQLEPQKPSRLQQLGAILLLLLSVVLIGTCINLAISELTLQVIPVTGRTVAATSFLFATVLFLRFGK